MRFAVCCRLLSNNAYRKGINKNDFRQISTTNYCIEKIRKHDYENFICSLLLRNEARSAAIALRAFNVEIASLQDQVSNTNIGAMRFKFWENAIESCYSKAPSQIPNHPVIVEVYRILQSHKLTKRYFLNLIKSREELMLRNSFYNIEEMENYAEKSVSSLYYLLLESSNVRNVHADHAASHLGKAQGLCHLLRGVPLSKQTNFIALPQNLLSEKRVSHEDIVRGKTSEDMNSIIFEVASRANSHLTKARSLSGNLSDDAKLVLLPATVVDNYLQKLLHLDCNIFHKKLQTKNYFWISSVLFKKFRKTY